MAVVLDTNAVSAALAGSLQLQRVLAQSGTPAIPIPVIGEYWYGLYGSASRAVLEPAFQALLAASSILHPDQVTAMEYARVRRSLRIKGRPIPENDIWIAALALQHQMSVVSQDRHFDLVDGLHRVAW